MAECDHEVVPLDDDPTMGRCTKCGDDTFPLVDPDGRAVDPDYVRALLLRPVLERQCDELREALRRCVIKDGAVINNRVFPCWCVECNATWDPGFSERHADGCLAAPVDRRIGAKIPTDGDRWPSGWPKGAGEVTKV